MRESKAAVLGLEPTEVRHWWALPVVALGIAALLIVIEQAAPATLDLASVRLSVHVSILAALLLAASAVFYLGHLLLPEEMLGRAASAAAALGAGMLLGASLARWWDIRWLAAGELHFSLEYEVLTWAAALCVYAYLSVENIYRTRSAGAFVLGCVLLALVIAAWLIGVAPAPDATFTTLTFEYVQEAIRVTGAVALAALTVLATMSLTALVRRTSPTATATVLARLYGWTAVVAFCALTFAVAFALAGRVLFGAAMEPGRELKVLGLWVPFAVALAVWRLRGGSPDALFRWMIGAQAAGLVLAVVMP